MKGNSFFKLLDIIKDEETAISYFEKVIWKGNPKCSHCASLDPYKTNRGWKCSMKDCKKKFTIKSNTIFYRSKIPMRIWLFGIYLFLDRRGISSRQLAKQLDLSQKTTWLMLHKIRTMLGNIEDFEIGLNSVVEADETFEGGRDRNKHMHKRRETGTDFRRDGKQYEKKRLVIGIIERGERGRVKLEYIPNRKRSTVQNFIKKNLKIGKTIYTDELKSYIGLDKYYDHRVINHSKCYGYGETHTNTMEGFFGNFKPHLYSTYKKISKKHLPKYLNEFQARFNTRWMDFFERIEYFLKYCDCYKSYNQITL